LEDIFEIVKKIKKMPRGVSSGTYQFTAMVKYLYHIFFWRVWVRTLNLVYIMHCTYQLS